MNYWNTRRYILTDNTEQSVWHAHHNFTFSIESGIQQHNEIIYWMCLKTKITQMRRDLTSTKDGTNTLIYSKFIYC